MDEDFKSEEEKEEEDVPDSDFDEPVSAEEILCHAACVLVLRRFSCTQY